MVIGGTSSNKHLIENIQCAKRNFRDLPDIIRHNPQARTTHHLLIAQMAKQAGLLQEAQKEIQKIFDEGLYPQLDQKQQIKVLESQEYFKIAQASTPLLHNVHKEKTKAFVQEEPSQDEQEEQIVENNISYKITSPEITRSMSTPSLYTSQPL